METVNHTEEVFRVVEETGFRATVGKCMMDKGEEVPAGLQEETEDSIGESLALLEKWHGARGRARALLLRAALRRQLHARACWNKWRRWRANAA